MSATGRGSERVAHDVYCTPRQLCAQVCSQILEIPNGASILEPSAGSGNFVRALRAGRPSSTIEAVEVRPEARASIFDAGADSVWVSSFLDWSPLDPAGLGLRTRPASWKGFDWIVGNPPYSRESGRFSRKTGKPIMEECATEHVAHALSMLAPGGHLAFLLRLSWYAPAARDDVLGPCPPWRIVVLRKRPSFVKGGTDSAAYAIFEWIKGHRGGTMIERF